MVDEVNSTVSRRAVASPDTRWSAEISVRVRRLQPDDWQLWRDIRLESLADAPSAYGSSLAREQTFGEPDWRGRLSGKNGVVVVAMIGEEPAGCMAVYTPPGDGWAMLVAAWVRPSARGRGVGDALVAELLALARAQGYPELELRVADGNDPARKLFLRNGFLSTGEREPLESDPSIDTERMVHKFGG
jgi:ribosomal protein S18 acetylase RimI-like enzyme